MNDLEPRFEQDNRLKEMLGYLLVVLGVIGAGWIVLQLLRLIADPSAVTIVYWFSDVLELERSILVGGQAVVMPAILLTATGIFIFLAILGIAAGIAKALITGGVHLLGRDVRKLLREIARELHAGRH